MSPAGPYWNFSKDDFDVIVSDITKHPVLEDRLIALSLAFELYKSNKRPKAWLAKIKKTIEDNEVLQERFELFLNSPLPLPSRAEWTLKYKQQEKERQKNRKHFSKFLSEHSQELRDNGLGKGVVSNLQYKLYQEMRRRVEKEEVTRQWGIGNWQCLIEDYGLKTAQAFRDGMLNFWRSYTPKLRSEKDEKNTIAIPIIFGLSGLAIEATEIQGWSQNLSEADATLACRYAFQELNGFPNWFPCLYRRFQNVIKQLILKEMDWELEAKEKKDYTLARISWSCAWLWDDLAPALLAKLDKEPLNAENLGQALKVIQRSSTVSDHELSEVAAKKCKTLNSIDNLSHWFSVWIGTNADLAIKNFSYYLETLNDKDPLAAKELAMKVIVNLIGKRNIGSSARKSFKTPNRLKDLYLLTYKYVKAEEDINRAGKGVYSPELRDDAQDTRNRLLSMLIDIPGKESFLAMLALSNIHPMEKHRIWMRDNAKKRAELDADISPWTSSQFLEFNKSLEITPENERELFELIVQRILDWKYQLEEGDDSIASTLEKEDEEIGIRKVIASWCGDRSVGKYTIAQEYELADGKKPDLFLWALEFMQLFLWN